MMFQAITPTIRRICSTAAALCILNGCSQVEKPPVTKQAWPDDIIYFVLVDRFADGDSGNNEKVDIQKKGHFHGGDLQGVIDNFDEIASLGVTTIWLNPLVKNIPGPVTGAGFEDYAYHGYWAEDFSKIDERFGHADELKELVDLAHRHGIKVLLDVVYNHPGYASSYAMRPDQRHWVRLANHCGEDAITKCLSGLPDFRTEIPHVADYLIEQQLKHAKAAGVDGFRLDTVKHVDHAFWQAHRKATRNTMGNDFFLLGEVWGGNYRNLDPWFRSDEMDAGFDFSFQGNTLSWVEGRGRTVAYSRYLKKRHRVRSGYHLSQYLSSHDVTGGLVQLKDDKEKFRLAAGLQLSTVGIPMIFYGEEVGRKIGEWPYNRTNMPWGEKDILPGKGVHRDESMRQYYQQLIQTRKSHKALSRGRYQEVYSQGDLLIFARTWQKETVWVVANRGQAISVTLPAPATWQAQAMDAVTQTQIQFQENQLTLSIPALGFQIITPAKAVSG
ncbi:alpha-amylase family glycosyl hydrolase [Algicola sagamiensis]|uniref:alpha-amylase family glycosyl hydrolase n=1 Tax=Algicola sagamiensis TaxID=163869 RepID=UPI00037B08B2|nr:alpha-amylase family glycosyl hydrolase [Algicola sagamiensis]